DTDTDTDTDIDVDKDAIYEAFFDPAVIQTVDLTLSEAAIRALNRNGNEYVEGDLVVNGTELLGVGVRLKGSSTYMDLNCEDGYCKAAFKIKTDEFDPEQKYGSLQRITLNNMGTDYIQSREVIVYSLLHDQSQLASRASFARVTLNGEAMGLYANVEAMDDEWIERRFADATGNLWATAAGGAEFTETGMYFWELNNGTGEKDHLRAIMAALDAWGGDFFGELGPVVNVDQFLDYWAWCAAVGNYDGYPFHSNDVILYEDPSDARRVVFMPWGEDETFNEYETTGETWNTAYLRLGYACLLDAACVAELKVRIEVAVDAYDEADMLSRAQAAWDLTESDVQTDPKRPFTPDDVWYYRDYYAGVIDGYDDYVRAKVGL
ncbi:MAG: hypothetical protein EXR71_20400, partial [Myxococcales bacterium]|nr:hypothetical protein [Myxococcales bacterium]